MVNTGLYVIKSTVLNFITKNNKMDMDELLNKLLKKRKRIKIFQFRKIVGKMLVSGKNIIRLKNS